MSKIKTIYNYFINRLPIVLYNYIASFVYPPIGIDREYIGNQDAT